jgi:hypothetical protein
LKSMAKTKAQTRSVFFPMPCFSIEMEKMWTLKDRGQCQKENGKSCRSLSPKDFTMIKMLGPCLFLKHVDNAFCSCQRLHPSLMFEDTLGAYSHRFYQGRLTEGEGSVRLTSSLS